MVKTFSVSNNGIVPKSAKLEKMKKQSPSQPSNWKTPLPNFYQIIGTVLIVATFFFTNSHFALPVAALAWGAIIIAFDRYLAYKSAREEREIRALKTKMERGAIRYRHKSDLLDKLMAEGLPEGMNLPGLKQYLDQLAEIPAKERDQLDLKPLKEKQKIKKEQ